MKTGKVGDIFYRYWEVLGCDKVIVAIPGLGCHSLFMTNIGENANLVGASVLAIDLPGFGQSGGKRGDFGDFTQITDAVGSIVLYARGELKAKKVFILGSSFGGLTAGIYAAGKLPKIDGMILCGAALTGMIMQALFKVLGDKELDERADLMDILPEPILKTSTMRAFIDDPLAVTSYTKRFVVGTIKAREFMWENAGKIGIPTLDLLGSDDKFVTVQEQEKFVNLLASSRKEFKILSGLDHSFGGIFDNKKIEVTSVHKPFFESVARFIA